jgi:hypothetical protein
MRASVYSSSRPFDFVLDDMAIACKIRALLALCIFYAGMFSVVRPRPIHKSEVSENASELLTSCDSGRDLPEA